ncbi:MAG: ABC transporter permease subunit [Planctomycetes bacterium]|nr:ABC transporter permease subunit [Planctomycetota bacterium]
MSQVPVRGTPRFLPISLALVAVLVWAAVVALGVFPESLFPSPRAVARGMVEELRSGRLLNDAVASLFRVGTGFALAVVLGIPLGLWLGHRAYARAAMTPAINFFRNLSPLAWMPFAVLWFGIGDVPAIFLIFMASFFPLALAATLAVASIPSVYFRVASDHGIGGWELVARVSFPAILPEVITALRVTAGVAWVVVVAAEMVAGRDGLGFAVLDARNGLRTDLVVVEMIVIGAIGVIIDRLLAGLTRLPSVRWGYER